MNERIRELWDKAAESTAAFPSGQNNSWETQVNFMEKFADLIVRECIERVRSQYIPVRDSTVEGRTNPFHPQLKVRTEREEGVIECGVNSVIALEELIQEQTDKWYEENILGVE
jgi:hypothetical protein